MPPGRWDRLKALFRREPPPPPRAAPRLPPLSVRETTGYDPDSLLPGHEHFRRASGASIRTVPTHEHRQALHKAFTERRQNPIAHRIVEMRADFIVGTGMRPQSEDEELQDFLTEFWEDPVNDFPHDQHAQVTSFRADGEALGEPLVNPVTGRTRILWHDVAAISEVLPHVRYVTKPGRVRFAWGDGRSSGMIVAPGEPELVVARWEDYAAAGVKPVLYYRTNAVVGVLRGFGDLYHLVEYVQALDNASFAMLERILVAITFVWILRGKGLRPREVEQILATLRTGKPGESLYLREGTTIESVFPDLKSGDFSEAFRTFKNLILGGSGTPEAWFGDGDAANRATLAEQGTPLFRSLLRAQMEQRALYESVCDFAVERAAEKGLISPAAAGSTYTIETEPISKQDDAKVADLLVKTQSALDYGVDTKALTPKEAALAYRALLTQIVDVSEELPDELLARLDAPPAAPGQPPAGAPPAPGGPLLNPDGTPNEAAEEKLAESYRDVFMKLRPRRASA